MYTGEEYPGPVPPSAPYPVIVNNDNNHRVLIVQAASFTKFIGDLTVYFDADGHVVDWEGAPIYLDSQILRGL